MSLIGGLGTTYDIHFGLIGKRAVDFLLALIEFFSLGVTACLVGSEMCIRDRRSGLPINVN